MRVLDWEAFSKGKDSHPPLAAAIGVFDGLHLGHRALVAKVMGRPGLASAVVTFRENPKRILRPESFHGDLSTIAQKLEGFDALGVDVVVLIDFSGDFSKLAGKDFLSLLRVRGDLRVLAVGTDFRCGHRLDTGPTEVREFCADAGIVAEMIPALNWAGHPISSSRIRKAVVEGRIDDAAAMLGRRYEIDLRGSERGDDGRFRSMNGFVLPPPGIYRSIVVGREGEIALESILGPDGAWEIGLPDGFLPSGIRLIASVSRE